MSRYRVSFFKNLLSSSGHQFKCLQQQIGTPQMDSADHARESATREFEHLRGTLDWRLFADSVEIESAKPVSTRRKRQINPRKAAHPE
jgi:hypothetical protein